MTPQEKHALLQFMGTAYGDAHKQDQMIVGQSGQLKPNAHELKQQFEQIAATPAYQQQNAPAPAPVQGPVATPQPQPEVPSGPVQPVSIEQAAKELAQIQSPPSPLPTSNDQLELDLSQPTKIDKLIKLVEEQHLLLKGISLKLGDGKKVKPIKKG